MRKRGRYLMRRSLRSTVIIAAVRQVNQDHLYVNGGEAEAGHQRDIGRGDLVVVHAIKAEVGRPDEDIPNHFLLDVVTETEVGAEAGLRESPMAEKEAEGHDVDNG